jgi:hypothetical protein
MAPAVHVRVRMEPHRLVEGYRRLGRRMVYVGLPMLMFGIALVALWPPDHVEKHDAHTLAVGWPMLLGVVLTYCGGRSLRIAALAAAAVASTPRDMLVTVVRLSRGRVRVNLRRAPNLPCEVEGGWGPYLSPATLTARDLPATVFGGAGPRDTIVIVTTGGGAVCRVKRSRCSNRA